MKTIIAVVVTLLVIMIPVSMVARQHAKKDVEKQITKVTTMEFTRKPEETAVVETTIEAETTEEGTTKRPEYDLYEKVTIKSEQLPISFSGTVKEVSFNYVPYESRTENDFYFYSILRVEVAAPSEKVEIYFNGSDQVFPGSMPEAVVHTNTQQHTAANYELNTEENSATMNGFESGLNSIEIIFPSYMSAINLQIGDDTYEVTCLQVVFTE